MTNTIPNVPRELLADLLGNDHDKRIMAERHLLAMLANAPSPAGVDGWEVAGDILEKLSDATAIIDGLRGEVGAQRVKTCTALKERNDAREERDAALVECERRQMQLAACGVVALANTIESACEARQMHPDYMSASCSDVADAVDREIALRTERDQQAQRIGELEVIGHIDSDDDVSGSYAVFKNDCDLRDGTELVRLSDAMREIARIQDECELLRNFKIAYNEWQDKTEWVQHTATVKELGKHRADVLKDRLSGWIARMNQPYDDADLGN